ncbi:MAG: winged helix-turn-helix domain-containing protein [Acidobacteria bacterium]|nr:winged helix-turn-helix domain-containing protein [Acidobacteriota bacterium]MBI3421643.1 winged helix-turn-helix domain-containing protein [Acidobacteriota bacterium]
MPANSFYEFGKFRIDGRKRLLLRDGEVLPLTPKAFDTLLVLVEQRARVLEKDELMTAVWGDTIVEESGLTRNISVLRKTLGESKDEHQFIVTVPGRGYRFVAEVREAAEEVTELVVQEAKLRVVVEEEEDGESGRLGEWEPRERALVEAPPPHARQATIVVATACVLLLAGAAYWWQAKRISNLKSQIANPPSIIHSLAVLPFKSLTAPAKEDYLGTGLADVLITRLSNVSALAVRPTTSVLKFAGNDPLQAGRDLQVDAVLDGSIQQIGDRVRVTVRLVRVADGQSLWAYQCDQQCNDVFTLQDTISAKVTEALALKLSGNERERIARPYSSNQAAWEAYAKGRYYRNRAGTEGYAKALASFQQALQADPKFALAYAALAEAYYWSSSSVTNMGEAMAKAKAAAQQAIALDNELAEAHTALGVVHFMYDWQFAAAEQELKRAVALNPGLPDGQMWYGKYLALMGRFDESIAVLQRAAALDPVSPLTAPEYTFPYFLKGDYAAAIAGNTRMLAIEPNLPQIQMNLAVCYAAKGEYAKAIALFERVRQNDAGLAMDMGLMLAYTYASAGDHTTAERTLKQTIATAKGGYIYPYDAALAYGALGDLDQAFAWLEKGYQERVDQMAWLKVDPRLKPLRRDPRFADLLRRVGLS